MKPATAVTGSVSYVSWDNGEVNFGDDRVIGYSIRMSMDDLVATLVLRCDEPITNRILIEALLDLVKEIEQNAHEDWNGDH